VKRIQIFLATCVLSISAWASAEDPIADLKEKIKSGNPRLEFDSKYGYLASLMKTLNVPVSSQTLVFTKTSLQSEGISPATPRAIYFNDDVYVAWVQGAPGIEIMSVDPKRGSIFYILGQDKGPQPEFELVTGHICSSCHYVQGPKKFVPLLVVSSIIPDEKGSVEGAIPFPTTDQTPMNERWGGWYVTGTHGAQRHLGNVFLKNPASPIGDLSRIDFSKSSNVTDLSTRFDTSRYPSPHSDIVALMVLAHQVEVHNLIAIAEAQTDAEPRVNGEPLVRAMLFSGAVPLKEAVKGTSNFAAEFSDRGPRDSRGRSLRDFDLKTRLFRYPLSYMIYSKAFDGLPDGVKAYVYRRLRAILSGEDKTPDFSHLTASDRTAILEILQQTKPDFR